MICATYFHSSFYFPLFNSSIVWSSSVPESQRLLALTDEQFLVELNTALQTPSLVDRWSPFNLSRESTEADSTAQDGFPSFSPLFGSILKPLQNIAVGLQQPLKRAKREVAALADAAMNAALLQVCFVIFYLIIMLIYLFSSIGHLIPQRYWYVFIPTTYFALHAALHYWIM